MSKSEIISINEVSENFIDIFEEDGNNTRIRISFLKEARTKSYFYTKVFNYIMKYKPEILI